MKIIFTVLIVILICFVYLICRFYLDVNSAAKKDDSALKSVNEMGEHLYSFAERGLYGVKDSHDNVVISPAYKTITQLSHDRYIVSRQEMQNVLYGIIDINENVVVPFIYSRITNQMNEYLVGCIAHDDNTKYVLMDTNGSAIAKEEWDGVSQYIEDESLTEDSNYIEVKKNNDIYRFVLTGNIFELQYMQLERDIFGDTIIAEDDDISHQGLVSGDYDVYTRLVDSSAEFVSSLFSDDYSSIKNMSFDEDYKALIPEDMNFRGGNPVFVDSVVPRVSVEEGVTVYQCDIRFMYTSPGSIQWDGSVTPSENAVKVSIFMKKNENGFLKIFSSSAEEIDIQELDRKKYESYSKENTQTSYSDTDEQSQDDENEGDEDNENYSQDWTDEQYTENVE